MNEYNARRSKNSLHNIRVCRIVLRTLCKASTENEYV
jgi:hypothetical protein